MCAYSTIACIFLENDNEQTNLGKFGSTKLKCKSLLTYGLWENTRADTVSGVFLFPLTLTTAVDCTVVACYSNNEFFFLKNLET